MEKNLLCEAVKVRENAYAPYSKFKVGAALLTDTGIFTGCNVENASYGLTCCAERNAIFNAVASGAKDFECLCVVADTQEPVSPCGACRQVFTEFNIKKIILANCQGKTVSTSVEKLLPASFVASNLIENK